MPPAAREWLSTSNDPIMELRFVYPELPAEVDRWKNLLPDEFIDAGRRDLKHPSDLLHLEEFHWHHLHLSYPK